MTTSRTHNQCSLLEQKRLANVHNARPQPVGGSKLVRRAESAPMPALDSNRHVDLAHHDGLAVAHVAGVALDQIGAHVAAGGQPRDIVEDAAVAAVRRVPDHVAGTLWM